MRDDGGNTGVGPRRAGSILVVDDDEVARRVAISALTRAGYATRSAETGEEALETFATHGDVDLVLLDINMPGIDGFTTCERIRLLPSGADTPIVFVTSADDSATRSRALASEADDFLAKPIDRTELLMRVRSLVRMRRLNEERRRGFDALAASEEALRQLAERLTAKKDLLDNLLRIARAGAEWPSLEPTLRNVMSVVKRLTGSEGAAVFFIGEEGELRDAMFLDQHSHTSLTPEERRRLVTEGVSGWVARHRVPARVADCTKDERWIPLSDLKQEIRSLLCVPVSTGARLVGVLNLVHSGVDRFTEEHQALLQAAGDQIALALRNAQMFDRLERMASRQDLLYQVLRLAAGGMEQGRAEALSVLRPLVTLIAERTGWADVGIALSGEGAGLHVRSSGGISWPGHGGNVHSFPLLRSGEELGVMAVTGEVAELGADDRQLAESLADALSLALQNAFLYQRAADESRRLLSLIQSSRDGILLVGRDGTVEVVNEPACALLSLPGPAEDYRSRPFAELRRALPDHPGLAELSRSLEVDAGASRPGGPWDGASAAVEGRYEMALSTRWHTVPVVSGDATLGRLCVLHDVTDERRAQIQREDLTNAMVHDLRTPLASVTGFLRLLEHGTGGAEPPHAQLELLQRARRAAERLGTLIDSIMDVARLEDGSMPLERASTDVAHLIAEVLDLQAPLAAEKSLELRNEAGGSLPPILVDVELVRRVLQNLVGNAVKFTPPGGTIVVAAEEDPANRRFVLVQVRDTGPGLSPTVSARLFEKFVTGPEKGRGTGLGLAFCRLVVEAHGGRIQAASEPGRGSTFTFSLPRTSP